VQPNELDIALNAFSESREVGQRMFDIAAEFGDDGVDDVAGVCYLSDGLRATCRVSFRDDRLANRACECFDVVETWACAIERTAFAMR